MRKIKTDEEIRFAMERCGTTENKSCEKCPYYTNTATCVERMLGDALDLINRQQAEIERLRKALEVVDLMEEQHEYHLRKAKAEAIKEFAERLKGEMLGRHCMYFNYEITNVIIDNLVKGMVGDAE